ncbi:MAG: hypothetical protein EOP06_02575 [Proteobacteria bacterium]|nr:MAG: hypothetical protein EOP06_02575 [Pseudomonadota bacterium]
MIRTLSLTAATALIFLLSGSTVHAEVSPGSLDTFIAKVTVLSEKAMTSETNVVYRHPSIGIISTNKVERVDFANMARITRASAEKTALDRASGNILSWKFETVEGYLCHEFEIVRADKSIQTVAVDAGDNSIRLITQENQILTQ